MVKPPKESKISIVELQHGHVTAMEQAAAKALPGEACGLLMGNHYQNRAIVKLLRPAPNILRGTPDRFEIDPAFLLAHHRAAREAGLELLGHFHSHPNGVAEPSLTDAKWAHDPGAIWVILAVKDGVFEPPQAYLAGETGAIHNRFTPVEVEIMSD